MDMAESAQRPRRAILAGAVGAALAVLASALGRPRPAAATNGDTITVGNAFTATNTTHIQNSSNANVVFWGESSTGYGLYGLSDSNAGTYGHSANASGVVGSTGTYLVSAPASTGVFGQSTESASGRGVWGKANGGRGVYGEATSGAGVYGYAASGYAIEGNGRLRFLKVSGVATIATGDAGVAVSPGVAIGSGSFVLLTPMVDLGGRDLWFTTNDPADTFAIHMSSARATPTKVSWLLLG